MLKNPFFEGTKALKRAGKCVIVKPNETRVNFRSHLSHHTFFHSAFYNCSKTMRL